MRKLFLYSTKTIFLLVLLAFSISSVAQTQKESYKLKYTTGTGRSVEGDLVTMTFFVLNINAGDCESLATLIRAQDGVKKVRMSPASAENNALCAITISKTFPPDLVQKMLKKVGFDEIIVDGVTVPMDNLHDYMSNLKKQKTQK
ncbi:MAG: hypothetical protein IPP64_11110 [Bacteroidetes bacterium]|nr:hypothetical protein [Bacteroidota bacterium]